MPGPIGIYFHWPFCLAKCPYCDFNVHVRDEIDHDAWREAYLKAINYYAGLMPGRPVASIFFGGGTPSLMAPQTVAAIIDEVQKRWPIANDIEITLEANPTSVEMEKFEAFRAAGVNRVSLGVQSLNDADLAFLGRKHNAAQAIAALDTAGRIFPRLSFDLIYARPGQTLDAWRDELGRAFNLTTGHLSLYQLTIERSTPFYLDHAQKKFTMHADDAAAEFYNVTQDMTATAGLPAYEVSNHARPGEESRHNLIYWRYRDYIGIGPGAHGRLTMEGQKFATREHSAPDIWLAKMAAEGRAHHEWQPVAPRERFLEALMMGLRLGEGIPDSRLEQEGGQPLDAFIDFPRLEALRREGFILHGEGTLRLTNEGMLRLNAIVPYILRA